jgi:RND superfamily putative drug exporter
MATPTLFQRWGELCARRPRLVVGVWLVVLLAAIPVLPRIQDPLKVGGFTSDNTEARRAVFLIEENLAFSPSTMIVVFRSTSLTADAPAFHRQVDETLVGVRTLPNVVDVVLPSEDASLVSADRDTAYALVGLDLPPDVAQRVVPAFRAGLGEPADLDVTLAGGPAFYADVEMVSQRDLRRAETIALPFALIALVLVFGSLVAAAIPLAVGGLAVAGVLFTIYWLAQVVDLSIFTLNLATMLGLGLAVDYSLFVTSRFREELAGGEPIERVVGRTMATAGRAIFFSGLTVLIGLAGLIFFDMMFLRSVGICGVIVVFFSLASALTLLPAVLSQVGTRIDAGRIVRLRAGAASHDGLWARLARAVMARPVVTLIPTLGLLILLGLPFWHAEVSSPDATILPRDVPSRDGLQVLVDEFGEGEVSPFVLAIRSPTTVFARTTSARSTNWSEPSGQTPTSSASRVLPRSRRLSPLIRPSSWSTCSGGPQRPVSAAVSINSSATTPP